MKLKLTEKTPFFFIPVAICMLLPAWVLTAGASQALKLADALEIAMKNSPMIRSSELNLRRSQASLNAAKARLKSKFSLSLTPVDYSNTRNFDDMLSAWYTKERTESYGVFRVEQPIRWTDGTISLINRFSWQESYSDYTNETVKNYTNDFYISLEQPIFTYNRAELELETLELDLEKNRLEYLIRRLSIEKQVTETFYQVYKTQRGLEIAEEDYQIKQESFEIMRNKVDAGIGKKEDLYQAELNLAKSKSELQNQRVQLEDALDNFKKLLGIPIKEEITILADVTYTPVDIDLDLAIENGLKNRMEIRQTQIEISNAENELVQTGANNEFWGDINLSYGSTGMNEKFQDLYTSPDKDQRLSLTLEIPLWDWGEKESMMEASRATIQASKLDLENQKTDIMIEIREAFRNLQNQITQIEIADQNVRLSQLTYEINLERYKNGDLTSKDMNDYQNQLSREKNSRVSSLIQYKLYLLEMKIKSLWDFENDRSVMD